MKKIRRIFLITFLVIFGFFGFLDYHFSVQTHFRASIQKIAQEKIIQHHIHSLKYSKIPRFYYEAVTATEDRRFAWDFGIDPIGIARAAWHDVFHPKDLQGASTITQQLVDNLFLHRTRTIRYKITQIFYAIGIYDTFSKSQTFALYANLIYFGNGAYGLFDAAHTYFGKFPQQLNQGQLALLAGLPNAPSNYNPFYHLALAHKRENIVLLNMIKDGKITAQQAKKIAKEPLQLI